MQPQIYHITDNYSPGNTGVTTVITQLTRYLSGQELSTSVLAAGVMETRVPEGVGVVQFPLCPWGHKWRYPDKAMRSYLQGITGNSGIILHLHGVWGAPQWLAARTAMRQGVPSLLTAHDMLSPWHWQDGRLKRLKKLAYWRTLAYPAFRHLPLIHAITPAERDNLALLFPKQLLEIIPNAIDLEEADKLAASQPSGAPQVDGPYLLFLGRLHPKKGVDLLIAAFARASKGRSCRLLIAGPDNTADYTARLKGQVRVMGLENKIIFLGPVFGAQKWQLYRHAWGFCAPSLSETVGLVNLEAAAARVPVITTHETGLFDWEEGGGLLVRPRVDELAQALTQVLHWSESERNDRGQALRNLVEQRYSWKAVGPQWLELYASLL